MRRLFFIFGDFFDFPHKNCPEDWTLLANSFCRLECSLSLINSFSWHIWYDTVETHSPTFGSLRAEMCFPVKFDSLFGGRVGRQCGRIAGIVILLLRSTKSRSRDWRGETECRNCSPLNFDTLCGGRWTAKIFHIFQIPQGGPENRNRDRRRATKATKRANIIA